MPRFGDAGEIEGAVGVADVHHDLDVECAAGVELDLLALESSMPS